jgi:hypothetical protein
MIGLMVFESYSVINYILYQYAGRLQQTIDISIAIWELVYTTKIKFM